MDTTGRAAAHPFVRRPHRTLLGLAWPVLLSLVAEPLTGLADTAFVAPLGSPALAALGVGTMLLSSVFWVFNFLGVATQTEVAFRLGAGRRREAREMVALALLAALAAGGGLAVLGWLGGGRAAAFMGARDRVAADAVLYLRIRLLAAPAVVLTLAAFGALRGRQDMRTPLWIAMGVNALNILLDAVLIPGLGPVPAFGIAGAAWATAGSQWLGALLAVRAVRARVGIGRRLRGADLRRLAVIGRDMFLRTGLLTLFLLLATRAATRIGAEAGAAHQAIRSVWLFTAYLLDAFAAAAQSLVGWFLGAGSVPLARRVAAVASAWGAGSGVLLATGMVLATPLAEALLVPAEARDVFRAAWFLAAVFQPLNALTFVTDGIHWGAGDFPWLRNGMVAATGLGVAGLLLAEAAGAGLAAVWLVTGAWIAVRTAFGVLRVWPGPAGAPLGRANAEPGGAFHRRPR